MLALRRESLKHKKQTTYIYIYTKRLSCFYQLRLLLLNGRCLKPHIFIFVPHCLLVDSDSGSGAGNKRNTHLVSRHDAKAGRGAQQQTQKHIVGAKTVETQQWQWGIRFW